VRGSVNVGVRVEKGLGLWKRLSFMLGLLLEIVLG
jgi:hypothetical protein